MTYNLARETEVFFMDEAELQAEDWRADDGALMREGFYWWYAYPEQGDTMRGPFQTMTDAEQDMYRDVAATAGHGRR